MSLSVNTNTPPELYKALEVISQIEQSEPAFEDLHIHYKKNCLPDEIKLGVQAVGKLIKTIQNGSIAEISKSIEQFGDVPFYVNGQSQGTVRSQFETKIAQLQQNLIRGIFESRRFTVKSWNFSNLTKSTIGSCACCKEYDRKSRLIFAEKIYKIARQNFNKTEFTICSLGSGGCLQELIIDAYFADRGCKINWVLVEKTYPKDPNAINFPTLELNNILNFYRGEKSNIAIHANTCDEYAAKIENGEIVPDILYAIDPEDTQSHENMELDKLEAVLVKCAKTEDTHFLIENSKVQNTITKIHNNAAVPIIG